MPIPLTRETMKIDPLLEHRIIPEAKPDFAPLEELLGKKDADSWMWMDASIHKDTGIRVEHYKHRDTRNYLALSLAKPRRPFRMVRTWDTPPART